MATAQTDDGRILQLWITKADSTSPPKGQALVTVDGAGNFLASDIGCDPLGSASAAEANLGGTWAGVAIENSDADSLLKIFGHVPPQASVVEILLADGASVRLEVQADGYFLGLVEGPGLEVGPDGDLLVDIDATYIQAWDADGNQIVEKDWP